jgi:hypothetical protein
VLCPPYPAILLFGTSTPKQHRSNRFEHTLHTTASQEAHDVYCSAAFLIRCGQSPNKIQTRRVCSNRAATQVNLLKCWEMCHRRITMICRNFASSSNLSCCLHTAEVAGSSPASPTLERAAWTRERRGSHSRFLAATGHGRTTAPSANTSSILLNSSLILTEQRASPNLRMRRDPLGAKQTCPALLPEPFDLQELKGSVEAA